MHEKVQQAVSYIQGQGVTAPEIGIVLGTGLGNRFIEAIKKPISVDYRNIPHFPVSTVEFHKGRLLYGEVKGKKVLAMQGRFHYYEGYSMQQITLPIRVMKMLGVKYLLISNVAGNMNPDWQKGQMMVIEDHINLQPDNPLRGKNEDAFGPRFPDMSRPYSETLNELLIGIAQEKNLTLNRGVYVSVMGPNLETRAEYKFLRLIGADAVGMSTVPEVIVANHMNLPCCAVSVLTDDCFPETLQPANIHEIVAIAEEVEPQLKELYVELIGRL